jgi:tRNA threonylcarbamoyladenosine biosynthesis protein TsaB
VKLLALDTSSIACTVGVQNGDDVVVRHEQQERAHTRLLVPMIRTVLRDTNLALTDLDAIVLGNGPGSFIGMRIAASVAQGLAYGANLKIVPVSSMAAVAAEAASSRDEMVVVAQDAHMGQVYLGIYSIDVNGLPVPAAAEQIHEQSIIDAIPAGQVVVSAGYGWQRYPRLLAANQHMIERESNVLYPSAVQLLTLGEKLCKRTGGISPQDIAPAYLRQKVAEIPAANVP